jgi:hypothetical protein
VISQVSKSLADVNISIMYVASLDSFLCFAFRKRPSGWRIHHQTFIITR